MSTLNDPATIEQDKRLRRALLLAARIGAENGLTGGWSKGYSLRDRAIDPDSLRPALKGDNDRAFRLLRDLVRKGLLQERLAPDCPLHESERFTLGHCDFTLTDKGARLLNEHEPIDPDIDDLRVLIR